MLTKIVTSFDLLGKETHLCLQIMAVLKQFIANASSIMTNRHLFQILLNSIYLIFKEEHTNIRFNDIIAHHQQVNNVNGTQLKTIVSEIEIEING